MSHPLSYVWQGESYKKLPHFRKLYETYQDNYTDFAGKNYSVLTSEQQRYCDDLGGKFIKAQELARDIARTAKESVAHVFFEMARPDRSLEPGGILPLRAMPKDTQIQTTKRPRQSARKNPKPYERKTPNTRAEQSQYPTPAIPPPPATRPVLVAPSQYQPPTVFTLGAVGPKPKPARRPKQS